jgi:UDP-GlcNAc:undecaprenyl-phosphate/decaprenyl-phosphate GlcNAc-1-phosphate transferase
VTTIGAVMTATDYLIYFALALGVSLPAVFLVRAVARRFELVARPRADRWHRKPTALYGGVGIFTGFILVALWYPPADFPGDQLLLLCSGGMFALGLLDDFVRLKPYSKLVGQIVFATAFTIFGTRLHWVTSPVVDHCLTIFWLVGIANAVNLLDNLDGLAGGVAAIAAAYLVYFCHASGQYAAAALAAAFCGAVVAFLFFNFNPASIFMGDCGSLFLGFFLGGLTLVSSQSEGLRRNMLAVLAVPVLLLLIPIVDTTLVTLTRKLHGRPVSQGGRDHTSHRLVALGLSERRAALVLWALAAASGGVAVAVRQLDWPAAMLLVPVFGIVLLFFLVFLGRVKVYEAVAGDEQVTGRAMLPTLADFAYKRRIFEVIHDVILIVVAYHGAFLLRFDGSLVQPFYSRMLASLPVVVVVQVVSFLGLGLYRGLWRYTSMSDLVTLFRAVGGAWIATVAALYLVFRLEGFSRGVLVMDGILLAFGIAGSRVGFRLLRTYLGRLQGTGGARRVLIYGAGDGGELLVRELLNNYQLGLHPIGFLDDDPQKHGRMIHGVRVLGSVDRLNDLRSSNGFEEIVISTDKIDSRRTAILARLSETEGVRTRRMRIALE